MLRIQYLNGFGDCPSIAVRNSSSPMQLGEKLKPPHYRNPFLFAEFPEIGVIRNADEAISLGCQKAKVILERCWPM